LVGTGIALGGITGGEREGVEEGAEVWEWSIREIEEGDWSLSLSVLGKDKEESSCDKGKVERGWSQDGGVRAGLEIVVGTVGKGANFTLEGEEEGEPVVLGNKS
jgi:hypothetical protein